ncbi:cell envelope-related function transcriptional attenuator common domain-containing protein [Nakamurella panacisegetis]|uniref:Cell envelope-related function transcriptional attenuator common domain-containing protein n=1 Tax=Nakamurella panacisegetis TaxID=1090615 RepID=A0A1H0JLH2_9ACTN|nr:LCP family protein [Nakamurella panacisegetis]SDO44333.1 cell envelope-related function transcriptional attenuator common domain-containing protein [Nakamurella panacisegetis]
MSDEPRDGSTAGDGTSPSGPAGSPPSHAASPPPDAASTPSAPWERPRRWNQNSLDATRVDDLLARLGGAEDAPSGRRRRRQAESDTGESVSASDLIAALTSDEPDGDQAPAAAVPSASTVPPTAAPAATSLPAEPAAATSPAAEPAGGTSPEAGVTVPVGPAWVTRPVGPPPTAAEVITPQPVNVAAAEATMVLPPRIGPNDPAPIRDLGDDPRTDFIPKMVGTTAEQAEADSIRAALQRSSAADPTEVVSFVPLAAAAGTAGDPPPPVDGNKRLEHSDPPPRRRRGLLYASRTVAALVAFITLLGVGVEWKIKDRADAGLAANKVAAVNLTDTHISAARTAATTYTNSNGVKTTEAAPPKTTYAAENILLLGSDTRAGGNGNAGDSNSSTSNGVANSDTLMVAHISGDRQHVTILSIPRDLIIPAPSCKLWNAGTNKYSDQSNDISPGQTYHINSAFSVGGPKCTVTAVQTLTGLGITRVIGIDFKGFQSMVDALGGVTVNVCRPVIDTELGTVVPNTGTQTIHGEQALNLVRARHVVGDTESDLARIRRQQIVLSAILRQVTAAGTLLNPSKLDNFLQAFTKNTFTDNVTVENLVTLAGSLGSLDPAHVTFYTLPTVPSTKVSGALDVDSSKAPAIFDDLVNDLPLPGEITTTSAKPKPTPVTPAPTTAAPSLKITVSPAKVDLEVYNVTGQANVATTAQQKLNAVGFNVTGDQLFKPDKGTQSGTTVLYAPTNRAAALTVAAAVPGSTLVVTPGLGTTVRLMLGASYAGAIDAVTVGAQAPASLATAVSTGPSIDTTAASSSGTATSGTTSLSSVNAGARTCI